jgi:hypothetical protein
MLLIPLKVVIVESYSGSVCSTSCASQRAMMERHRLGVGYIQLCYRSSSSGLLKAGSNLRSSPYSKPRPDYIRFSLKLTNGETR